MKEEVKIMGNSKVIEKLNTISTLINEIVSLLKEEKNVPAEEAKTISFEDFKSELIDYARDGLSNEIRDVIEKHGVNKISELKPDQYEEVLAEVRGIANGRK